MRQTRGDRKGLNVLGGNGGQSPGNLRGRGATCWWQLGTAPSLARKQPGLCSFTVAFFPRKAEENPNEQGARVRLGE